LFWTGSPIHSPIHFLVFLLCVFCAKAVGFVDALCQPAATGPAAGHPHHRHQGWYSSSSFASQEIAKRNFGKPKSKIPKWIHVVVLLPLARLHLHLLVVEAAAAFVAVAPKQIWKR
jgi:hypothetical protein